MENTLARHGGDNGRSPGTALCAYLVLSEERELMGQGGGGREWVPDALVRMYRISLLAPRMWSFSTMVRVTAFT